MIKRTYGEAKSQLARKAAIRGLPVNSPVLIPTVNRAIEELMHEGDWPGVVDRYVIRVFNQNLVLPADLDRLIGIAVERTPYMIRSPWIEFTAYGPGLQKDYIDNIDGICFSRGETPTMRDIPYDEDNPLDYTLVIYSMVDERDSDGERPTMTIRGYDNNGQWIRTETATNTWVEGEQFILRGDALPNYVNSTNFYINIASIEKSVTRGYVEVYAFTGSEPEQLITILAPKTTAASFRHYYIPGLPQDQWTELGIRARKRFVPITADEDYLLISNLPALETMVQAVALKDAGKTVEYANHKAIAVDLMKKEAKSYMGRPDPVVTIDAQDEGFGSSVPVII